MRNQFTFHHKSRIDTGTDKIWAKDRQNSFRLWILWTRNTKIRMILTWTHDVLHGTSRKSGEDIKTRCTGSIYNLLNRKDLSSIKQDRTQSSFMTHSQLIVARKLLWWNLEKSYTRKYMCHLGLLRRFLVKTIGWKNWIQQIQPKSKTQLSRTRRPVSEQPSGLLTQEIGKDVLFGCESTNSRTVRPVKSCVPVSVERVDKDKDADEKRRRRSNKNGETCEWTTNMFVYSARRKRYRLQSVWIATCNCETRRKLPRREMGNVELLEFCETIPKVQCSQCLLCWNQGVIYCTSGHFLVESESSHNFF